MSKERAVTTESIVLDEKANNETKAVQSEYTGNHHMDKVTVKFIKDGDYVKKGDVEEVHPTMAAIYKHKGLIGDYEKDIVRYNAPEIDENGQLKK